MAAHDDGRQWRITWCPAKCSGKGLVHLLTENKRCLTLTSPDHGRFSRGPRGDSESMGGFPSRNEIV